MHRQITEPSVPSIAWLKDALESLTRLAQLPKNWDSYGAEPPNDIALTHARDVLGALGYADLRPDYVDPSAESGVCLSFVRGLRYADMECFNSGEILAVISVGDGTPEVWDVPAATPAIRSAVVKIQDFLLH